MGGDFNVALNPQQDSSTGTTSLPYRVLRAIKKQLQELTLHDTWRTLHPNDRDFTFYSSPHNKYSRIDHFFISQTDLPLLKKATIEPMILSDHNPISITLTFTLSPHAHSIWRLDSSSLTDPELKQRISTRLIHYFQDNSMDEPSPPIIWAAHKCVVRGDFISIAAFRNKQRRAHITALSSKIHTLERAHKLSLATKSLEELLQAREALREEINTG